MRYLGIDYGHKNIGLALSDEQGNFAYPHSVIETKNALKKIAIICRDEKVSVIVIGESRDLQGEPNAIFLAAQRFAADLKMETGLPVYFHNETYSSREAQRIMGDDDNVDARAAAIILQSFLDCQRNLADK